MVLGRNGKIELLKRVPLFAGCSKAELREIAMIADEIDLRKGASLTKEGAAAHEFVVIVEGSARVTKQGKNLADLGAGDWVGEIALLTKSTRTATVTTTSPVRALVITDRAFRRLVHEMPAIAVKVLTSVADRLARDLRS